MRIYRDEMLANPCPSRRYPEVAEEFTTGPARLPSVQHIAG
ncbi:MAG: hypothetical protein ACXQTS_05915 [Candidatus Methanospirareceae archaeon]